MLVNMLPRATHIQKTFLGSRGGPPGWGSDLSKMFTIMKMVITMVENWSPDMIPVAFDRKFDELLNEIPPGIYRLHVVEIFQYWGWED